MKKMQILSCLLMMCISIGLVRGAAGGQSKDKLSKALFDATAKNNTAEMQRIWNILHKPPYNIATIDGVLPTVYGNQNNIIFYAIRHSNPDTMRFLVTTLGANPNHKSSGTTPLRILIKERQNKAMFEVLVECGARIEENPRLLHLAAKSGNLEMVEYFLDKDSSSINSKDKHGETPLSLAAENGHLKTVQFLLNKGADKDMRAQLGRTALHSAARNGHRDIVTHLLAAGARKEILDDAGLTPLALVQARDVPNKESIIELLKWQIPLEAPAGGAPQPQPQQNNRLTLKKGSALFAAAALTLLAGRYGWKKYKLYALKQKVLSLHKALAYQLISTEEYQKQYADLVAGLSPADLNEVEGYVNMLTSPNTEGLSE